MLPTVLVALLTCRQTVGEKLLDLSYDLAEDSGHWLLSRSFALNKILKGYQPNGLWITSNDVAFNEHTSTHMDAPIHFAHGTRSVDQIPLADLMAPAVMMDIKEKAAKDVNAVLDADDVMSWIEKNGPIPDGAVVFVRTGWGDRYHNKTLYIGTDTKDISKRAYPGIGLSAAKIFTGYAAKTGRRVVGVAIDTLSLDSGASKTFETHKELTKHNLYGIENVAKLEELPTTGAEVVIMPLKIRGGSGGPCRIIAKIPDGSAASGQATPAAPVVLSVLAAMTLARHF